LLSYQNLGSGAAVQQFILVSDKFKPHSCSHSKVPKTWWCYCSTW